MNKAQLIDAIAQKGGAHRDGGISKAVAEAVVNSLTAIIEGELANGGEVTLPGIGKLSVAQRAAREGRNPATGEALKIAAKKAIKFSVAKALKDAVNAPKAAPAKKGKK